jgi:hypothetical protein
MNIRGWTSDGTVPGKEHCDHNPHKNIDTTTSHVSKASNTCNLWMSKNLLAHSVQTITYTADKRFEQKVYPNLGLSWDRSHEPSQFLCGFHRDPVVVPPMHPHAVDIKGTSQFQVNKKYLESTSRKREKDQLECNVSALHPTPMCPTCPILLHLLMYFDKVRGAQWCIGHCKDETLVQVQMQEYSIAAYDNTIGTH